MTLILEIIWFVENRDTKLTLFMHKKINSWAKKLKINQNKTQNFLFFLKETQFKIVIHFDIFELMTSFLSLVSYCSFFNSIIQYMLYQIQFLILILLFIFWIEVTVTRVTVPEEKKIPTKKKKNKHFSMATLKNITIT